MRRLLLSLLIASSTAWAQTDRPANLEPLDEPLPPPQMEPFDESLEPQVTIVNDDRGTVEEFRISGKLYMVRVVPRVGLPFYLIDNDGDGRMETRRSMGPPVRPPMWVIGTF